MESVTITLLEMIVPVFLEVIFTLQFLKNVMFIQTLLPTGRRKFFSKNYAIEW